MHPWVTSCDQDEITRLKVFKDSALIIPQTICEWKMRDTKLLPYHDYLEELIEEFDDITFEYLPRTQNQFAEMLAMLSQCYKSLKIEVLDKLAYCMAIAEEPDRKPWYYDIKNYIQKQEFPNEITSAD